MKKSETKLINTLVIALLSFFVLLPSPGGAQTCTADRYNSSLVFQSTHTTIQAAVNAAATANIIKVSGTCAENVLVREEKARITLDGQGSAAIAGPDATIATLRIRGNLITVTSFLSISGGEDGILVDRTGTAVIINNTIESTGRNGIVVNESATARIGFSTGNDTVASPNTIQSNPNRGIVVTRHASARIVGNTIINNGDDGVGVFRVSQADIAGNTINSNGGDGVSVNSNSGVNLGNDTGTTIFDLPNNTTVNNGGFGVRCTGNSSADNRLGTLNGSSGQKSFSASCIDSLIP
jgi:hypothetical protein